MSITPAQRLEVYAQMLPCAYPVRLWELDAELDLISVTDASNSEHLLALFAEDCRTQLEDYLLSGGSRPFSVTGPLGTAWIIVPELAGEIVSRLHVLGPAFNADISFKKLERTLAVRHYGDEMSRAIDAELRVAPIVPLMSWQNLALMLSYCVTGEQLTASDICYPPQTKPGLGTARQGEHPRVAKSAAWLAEQEAMHMIEEGRLDYGKQVGRLSLFDNTRASRTPGIRGRSMKDAVIAFVTLATRAAIRGGLDPETSYYLGGLYIDAVEESHGEQELTDIVAAMFDDFVQRVHKVREESGCSAAVKACQNYIDLHLAEKVSVRDLARRVGYSETYLTEKFKAETGLSISRYILEARVARAKVLLRSTNRDVREIGESLGFCNPSYFSSRFREVTGTTPLRWRNHSEHPDEPSTGTSLS